MAQDEVTAPPISLKQIDTKDSYTVQMTLTAFSYFNFFTHSMNPTQVLEKCKEISVHSFDTIIEYLNEQYKSYCALSKISYTTLPWKSRVYTWKEFYDELASIHGEAFKDSMHEYAKRLHENQPDLDLRMFGLKMTQEAWKWSEDKSPAIIVYFGSVFSARIEMTGRSEKEQALLDAVEYAVEKIEQINTPIVNI